MTINTAEIEARLAKATPGPWAAIGSPQGDYTIYLVNAQPHPAMRGFTKGIGELATEDDAVFIAHAPTDIAALLAALKVETARADRYAERLEITSHWVSYDDGATLTRVEVPREDWDGQHDGIDCRDETIKLQDAAVDNLRDQLTAANEKLAAARERDLRLVEWLCCLLDEVKPDDATKAQAVKFLDAFNTGDGNGRT